MGKMKNYMMDIEEFCDDYFHAGEPYGVTPSAEEVAADAENHFNSKMLEIMPRNMSLKLLI